MTFLMFCRNLLCWSNLEIESIIFDRDITRSVLCEHGMIWKEKLPGIVSVTRLNILYPGDIRGYSSRIFR